MRKSVKKKYNLYQKFLRTRTGQDYLLYCKFRNECTKIIKASKREFERNVAFNSKTNPKQFWKYIQSKTKKSSGISSLIMDDGKLTDTDQEKAETLNSFFSKVFTRETRSNLPTTELGSKSSGALLTDIIVTKQAVKEKLNNLKPNKAQGPDNLPPRVLKELSSELAAPLCYLFNKSIQSGMLPLEWKTGEVTAIFKKGTKSDPGNYRPVSLTCVTCKVLESIIRDEIVKFFEDYDLYANCQHGFRKNRSCMTQLLQVMEDFTKYFEKGESFDILYLDFKKAFDSVPHQRLLIKLQSYGISGNLYKWIEDFLKNRTQRVRVGDSYSSTSDVLSGIPQGSILGPILFTIFINDLPEGIHSCCHIFADDTKIYNSANNHTILQNDINLLQKWAEKWCLFFNESKCKVMHAGKKNPKFTYSMQTKDEPIIIAECEEEKDLGVTFDSLLKFNSHINNAIIKANKILGLIKRSFDFIDEDVIINLYKSLVRPHLEYGNLIWYPTLGQSAELEKVQRRATKLVPSLRGLKYEERLEKLKLPSLKHRRKRGDMIQVFKIINKIDDLEKDLFFEPTPVEKTRGTIDKLYVRGEKSINLRLNVFSNRTVSNWNSLSTNIKISPNTNTMKNRLDCDPNFNMTRYDYDGRQSLTNVANYKYVYNN